MKKAVSLIIYVAMCYLGCVSLSSCGSDGDSMVANSSTKSGDLILYNFNGVSYFFRIIDSSRNYVEITWDRNHGENCVSAKCVRYTGALVVPSKIECNNETYTVTKVDDYAFYGSTALTSVTLPATIKEIGEDLFTNCSNLTAVTLNEGLTKIGKRAFADCRSLKDAPLPTELKTIGESAFENCQGLTELSIPSTVDSIGSGAFSGCKGLLSLTLSDDAAVIPDDAFSGCSSLQNVKIPSKVNTIGAHAFDGCTSLSTLVLGSSLTSIGMAAFGNCNNLSSIFCYSLEPPTCSANGVFSIYSATLNVYNASIIKYQSASEWSNFKTVKGI